MKSWGNWEKRLVSELLASRIIREDQKEIVEFGIVQGVRTALELLVMLVMGVFFHLFLESLLILVLFGPFRIYAGGYHAKTPLQCALKSWLLFACVLVWLKIAAPIKWLELATAVLLGGLLFLLAPMQHKNKPLEDYEIPKYRKSTFLIWGLESLLMLLAQALFVQTKVSMCVMLAMWMVALLMVLGWCENKKEKEGKS